MAKQWGLSSNDVLACLDVLSDVDSEHEVDIEDSLSCDESDPESKEVSDSYSEKKVQVNQIRKRSKMLTAVKFLEKMDTCGRRSQKLSEEHECAILSKRNQDRKGMDVKQTHP